MINGQPSKGLEASDDATCCYETANRSAREADIVGRNGPQPDICISQVADGSRHLQFLTAGQSVAGSFLLSLHRVLAAALAIWRSLLSIVSPKRAVQQEEALPAIPAAAVEPAADFTSEPTIAQVWSL